VDLQDPQLGEDNLQVQRLKIELNKHTELALCHLARRNLILELILSIRTFSAAGLDSAYCTDHPAWKILIFE